jgi:hypothetical protein
MKERAIKDRVQIFFLLLTRASFGATKFTSTKQGVNELTPAMDLSAIATHTTAVAGRTEAAGMLMHMGMVAMSPWRQVVKGPNRFTIRGYPNKAQVQSTNPPKESGAARVDVCHPSPPSAGAADAKIGVSSSRRMKQNAISAYLHV